MACSLFAGGWEWKATSGHACRSRSASISHPTGRAKRDSRSADPLGRPSRMGWLGCLTGAFNGGRAIRAHELARADLIVEARELLDAVEVGVAERNGLKAQPAPGGVLHTPSPAALQKLVARDPQQPRQDRSLLGAVAPRGDQRRREHLGREVGGDLAVAGLPQAPPQHNRQVAAIEHRERHLIPGGHRCHERRVRILSLFGHLQAGLRNDGSCDNPRHHRRPPGPPPAGSASA